MEVKYLAHAKQLQALDLIPRIAAEFRDAFGRVGGEAAIDAGGDSGGVDGAGGDSGGVGGAGGKAGEHGYGSLGPGDTIGLITTYRCEDADTIVLALGSVIGTIEDTVDELRAQGMAVGVVGLTSFRPFPLEAVRAALARASRVVVLEKALAVGIGGIVAHNVQTALAGLPARACTVIAGLGGRPITKASLRALLTDAAADRLEPLTFLDMDWDVVERELARMRASRASGPHAENILRDIGAVAAGPV